ncbi:MAG: hypothetical protein IPI02_20755 [Sterolibacteriaceae bacterium]|nr:hypothetical protein [Sterolibacteriaceae bacterium]
MLDQGSSIRQAGGQVGVTEGTIRRTLRRGELGRAARRQASLPSGPSERSQRAARGAGGVAVQRHTERALARMGQLQEAAPQFVAAEAVRYGVLYWRCRRCWRWGCWRRASRPMVR